jgi:c(7)-type cytochrome triheme protein
MRITTTWLLRLALVFGVALVATAALAQTQAVPRLPSEIRLTRSADSPGQVTFDHGTHVDSTRPSCTVCHPRDFRILKADAGRHRISHDDFDKGRQCGACHNGKVSFKIDEDCTNCHRG